MRMEGDDFVKDRYDPNRKEEEFRQFTAEAPPVVQEFYRLNHTHQTRDFVRAEEAANTGASTTAPWAFGRRMEYLNTLVDDSDPDTDLSQIEHCCRRPRRSAATGTRAGSS